MITAPWLPASELSKFTRIVVLARKGDEQSLSHPSARSHRPGPPVLKTDLMSRLETSSATTLHNEFARLTALWKSGRDALATAKRMAAHPAYREIIALGWPVVPLIIKELERDPDHWFIALHEITGASPVLPEARGKMDRMVSSWVDWWKRTEHA